MSYSAYPAFFRSLLCILSLFAFLLFFSSIVINSSRRKRRLLNETVAAVFAFLSLSSLEVLVRYEGKGEVASAIVSFFPAPLLVALICADFALGVAYVAHLLVAKAHRLSLSSYQDAYDAMEEGVCFYDAEGAPLLLNRSISEFSYAYMGHYYGNALEFLSDLRGGHWKGEKLDFLQIEAYKGQDDEVYGLKIYEHSIEGAKAYEMVITRLTSLYRLSRDLESANAALEEGNKRLQELGQEISALRKEEENLFAKKKIHDELGELLLQSKARLEKERSEEGKESLLRYIEKESNRVLSLQEKEVDKGLLEDLSLSAAHLGVKVSLSGEKIPPGKQRLVYEASLECLLNGYQHGKAKHLDIAFGKEGSFYRLSISNDGALPSSSFVEGSGLSALRGMVERERGEMKTIVEEKFCLEIKIPL